jgi:hypothetical protein
MDSDNSRFIGHNSKLSHIRNLFFALKNVSQGLILADIFRLRKITTDLHILARVNIDRPDDTYSVLKNYEYIVELTHNLS